MTFLRFMTFLFVAVCLFPAQQSLAGSNFIDQVQESLRNRIETAQKPDRLVVGSEGLQASASLRAFYEQRGFVPAWIDEQGPHDLVESLLQALEASDREGLKPQEYHLQPIRSTLEQIKANQKNGLPLNPGRLVDLDLLLSDAFLISAAHRLSGRVNPETFDSEWFASPRVADLSQALETVLSSGRIAESLQEFLPAQAGYWKLRQALSKYRRIAQEGEWNQISAGPVLKKGSSGERVAALKARLALEGEQVLHQDSPVALFDDSLEQQIRSFQRRHGLEADGAVGPATLAALNISAQKRARQIEINLERWRWLPLDLGRRHIVVNMAAFGLDVFEDGDRILEMRVIVGRDYRRTPVFSDRITYLVLNPSWNVPQGIAVKDKLPLIKKDPGYLSRQKMRVFRGWGAEAGAIDPSTIDWARLGTKNFPYRLRQDPGPLNALGKIKFMFPNRFNVYLHDTSNPELFQKSRRTLSSGCIRIEKPLELAVYLLQDDPRWSRPAIQDQIAQNREKTITLSSPVAVHLLYWTSFVDQQGRVHFREDIYGRDARLYKALNLGPSG